MLLTEVHPPGPGSPSALTPGAPTRILSRSVCLDVQPHRERRTDEPVAVGISRRVISEPPLHFAPRWHDPWEEVGDALLSELGSHRRSRQERMSPGGRNGWCLVHFYFPPGGGGGEGGSWVCWAGTGDGVVLRVVEVVVLLDSRKTRCVKSTKQVLLSITFGARVVKINGVNTTLHCLLTCPQIWEGHHRYRFSVGVGAHTHFHSSSNPQHQQTHPRDRQQQAAIPTSTTPPH